MDGVAEPPATDGSGFLALSAMHSVHFLAPDGTLLSQAANSSVISGQLSGFVGTVDGPDGSAEGLRAWDSHGSTVAEGPIPPGDLEFAEDPTGGIAVLRHDFPQSVDSYDTQLRRRWHVAIATPQAPVAGVAVDRAGRTLVVRDADPATAPMAADAVWIDRDGTAGPVFRILPRQSNWPHDLVRMTQRVGSGLFLFADQITEIDSLSTTPRPGLDFKGPFPRVHMVHDGRGYAVLPIAGGFNTKDCEVEVLGPSGKSCGKVDFGVCGDIAVGYDGTVVVQLPNGSGDCGPSGCTFHNQWQWWSGYFH